MGLFVNQDTTDVIKSKDITDLTGITKDDFQFENENAFNELLEIWITRVASHIYARINREISENDKDYEAIQDIIIRTVAKLVAVAQQQRTSPVVQIDNFAVNVLNTSEVTKELNKELKPFLKRKVSFFSSLDEYLEESE